METRFTGELGEVINRHSWGNTALGEIENWSSELKTAIAILTEELDTNQIVNDDIGIMGDRSNSDADDVDVQYQNLFDSIGQGFCMCRLVFDENGNSQDYQFLKTNRLYSQISGLKNVEGRWAREIMPNLEEFWFETYGQVVKTGQSLRVESYVAGLGRWFEVNAFPIADPKTPHKFGVLFTDISDRKKSERKLQESERIYRAIGESIKYGIWINNPQGQNVYASQSFLDLLGVTQAECSDLDWTKYLHPSESEETLKAWIKCVATESNWDCEHRYLGRDGSWHSILARGVPVRNDQGEIIYWAGINLDIAKFKRTQQALQESESRYRLLAESIPQLVWISSPEGQNEYVNQRMLDYTGLEFEELIEFKGEVIFHPDDWESTLEKWTAAIAEQTLFEHEYRLRSADGSYRWFIGRALPIKNEQGDATSWFGTATDIEEQKQLEYLYTKLLQGVQERNQDLDQFSQIVAHDLKAPLRAIANLTQWLEDDLRDIIPPENQRQIHLMRQRIQRMEGLIKGLLDYARIGRQNVPSTLVSVAELLAEIIDSLAPLPTFTIQVIEPLPTFSTKRMLLDQVLRNLIDNAIKHHNRHDGIITISVAETPNFYKFTVSDDGVGVEPSQQKRIFDIFQTLETQDQSHSTGIGLAIVKKIIETQGGTIELVSELHKGSTFSFTWRKPY